MKRGPVYSAPPTLQPTLTLQHSASLSAVCRPPFHARDAHAAVHRLWNGSSEMFLRLCFHYPRRRLFSCRCFYIKQFVLVCKSCVSVTGGRISQTLFSFVFNAFGSRVSETGVCWMNNKVTGLVGQLGGSLCRISLLRRSQWWFEVWKVERLSKTLSAQSSSAAPTSDSRSRFGHLLWSWKVHNMPMSVSTRSGGFSTERTSPLLIKRNFFTSFVQTPYRKFNIKAWNPWEEFPLSFSSSF